MIEILNIMWYNVFVKSFEFFDKIIKKENYFSHKEIY